MRDQVRAQRSVILCGLALLLCMAAATTVWAQNAKTASLRAWEQHVAPPFRPILDLAERSPIPVYLPAHLQANDSHNKPVKFFVALYESYFGPSGYDIELGDNPGCDCCACWEGAISAKIGSHLVQGEQIRLSHDTKAVYVQGGGNNASDSIVFYKNGVTYTFSFGVPGKARDALIESTQSALHLGTLPISSKPNYLRSQIFVKQFPAPKPLPPESGQKALEALERLQIKCNVGITYNDYLRTLGETAFTVERFIGNHSTDVHPVLLSWMRDALDKEEFAAKIWYWKIQADTDVIEAPDSATFLNLMAAHPECKMLFRGGSTTYGRVIRYFWDGAAEDINLVNGLTGPEWPILPAGTQ